MKELFKIILSFIVMIIFLCGFSIDKTVATRSEEVSQIEKQYIKTERSSEYTEWDKPWGEYNYRNIGTISILVEDLNENYTIAELTIEEKGIKEKVKIYGTDIKRAEYEGKKVLVAGVKDSSEDCVLVKYYGDVAVVDESLLNAINSLNSIENTEAFNEVKKRIFDVHNNQYRIYINELYNDKVSELSNQ